MGQHRALGYSPFAIDGPEFADRESSRSYDVLSQLAPLILENQPQGRVAGVLLVENLTLSQKVRLGEYTLNVSETGALRPVPGTPVMSRTASGPAPHGIFIAGRPDEFYIAGEGLNITFSPNSPGPPLAGLATVEEGRFVDDQWHRGRTLAGDDTGQGNNISVRGDRDSQILRVMLYAEHPLSYR